MRLIDKNGKLFGKFNALDLGIIILVLALGLGAFYKFKIVDKTSTTLAMQPISYTVEIKKVREFSYNNVEIGDILFDKTSGNAIGTIVNVEKVPALESFSKIDGTIVTSEVENRIDIILTIEAEGTISDSGHYVNRTYELVSGATRKFMTKYFECEGKVKEIL